MPSSVSAPTSWSIFPTLTALLRFVLKMPDDLVFGRILPRDGLMLCLSTVLHAWLAYRSRRRRAGPMSAPFRRHQRTAHVRGDFRHHAANHAEDGRPVKGWETGLTWVFIQRLFVLMIGGFVAPGSGRSPRARPSSAPWRVFRSPSFLCGPRWRCF